jgi:hypothetical protein
MVNENRAAVDKYDVTTRQGAKRPQNKLDKTNID